MINGQADLKKARDIDPEKIEKIKVDPIEKVALQNRAGGCGARICGQQVENG